MALAHLHHAFGAWSPDLAPVQTATDDERRIVACQIERGVNAPLTSSVGRLFDAVASLAGLRHRARYEAEAAIELEALAAPDEDGRYPVEIDGAEPAVVDPAPMIRGVVHDVTVGIPAPIVAARAHATVAAMIVAVAEHVRERTGLGRVVLSGGVFQNVTLLRTARRLLVRAGFRVFSHHLVPPNDGGIALGQAVVAHARLG
jgi:hydrogenase maturation protein HypF